MSRTISSPASVDMSAWLCSDVTGSVCNKWRLNSVHHSKMEAKADSEAMVAEPSERKPASSSSFVARSNALRNVQRASSATHKRLLGAAHMPTQSRTPKAELSSTSALRCSPAKHLFDSRQLTAPAGGKMTCPFRMEKAAAAAAGVSK